MGKELFITLMTIVILALVLVFAFVWAIILSPNAVEHEELRHLTCSDDAIKWANEHPKYIDHQSFARQIAIACKLGLEKPSFNG